MMTSDFAKYVKIPYSLEIIEKLISFSSNPKLGFRTSGSAAEFAAADFLYEEMKRIGLHNVRKEAVGADNFEFKKSELTYRTQEGKAKKAILASFQANCLAQNEPIEIVYVGKGGDADYSGVDAAGKYVLVDINMKDEWHVCWPLEEARAQGAVGIIAVQTEGYCTYSDETLGVQGISTYGDFPAFSMTVHDADELKRELGQSHGVLRAVLDADVRVSKNGITHNVIGEIPGEIDEVIYLIGHYDAYFRAFSDNASGIGCILGICRAFVESGYKPRRTLRVILHGAEEWGAEGTRYYWAKGAWMQVQNHLEWGKNGFFLLNLDGGVICGAADKAIVRTSYEVAEGIQPLGENVEGTIYPFGTLCPMWTWTESYMYASIGIPTIESHYEGKYADFWSSYHSTSDLKEVNHYTDEAFYSSHILYGTILQRLDDLPVRPLDFTALFEKFIESIDMSIMQDTAQLEQAAAEALKAAEKLKQRNIQYKDFDKKTMEYNTRIAGVFQTIINRLFGLDWDEILDFIHVRNQNNIRQLRQAISDVRNERWEAAIWRDLWNVDLCRYAFFFGREAYDAIKDQTLGEDIRETWGSGKVDYAADLFDSCKKLIRLYRGEGGDKGEIVKGIESALEIEFKKLAEKQKQEVQILKELKEQMDRC